MDFPKVLDKEFTSYGPNGSEVNNGKHGQVIFLGLQKVPSDSKIALNTLPF